MAALTTTTDAPASTPCDDCSDSGMVPAGGWEPPAAVTDGYVACPTCEKPARVVVGTVFVESWGYDQTNIDFYEVVRITPASVVVRQVAQTIDHHSTGAEYVVPRAGDFCGEPMTRRLLGLDSTHGPHINTDRQGTARVWDGRARYQTALGWGH